VTTSSLSRTSQKERERGGPRWGLVITEVGGKGGAADLSGGKKERDGTESSFIVATAWKGKSEDCNTNPKGGLRTAQQEKAGRYLLPCVTGGKATRSDLIFERGQGGERRGRKKSIYTPQGGDPGGNVLLPFFGEGRGKKRVDCSDWEAAAGCVHRGRPFRKKGKVGPPQPTFTPPRRAGKITN